MSDVRTVAHPGTVTERLVAILRESVFADPDRDIHVDEPLGEVGIGLDSLALVQFVTAVEQQLQVQAPMELWTRADELSLSEFGAALDAAAEPSPAPTDTERELITIWEELLDRAPIGPEDRVERWAEDPALLGQLLARTRVRFGVLTEGLDVERFLADPSVRTLVDALGTDDDEDGTLVLTLRAGGDAPPLFLIHAGGGYAFFYRALAAGLPADRPVYGIRADLQHGSGSLPRRPESFQQASCVEQVAARYLREIKAVQPDGPYAIGGACVGGVFAFEVARQLRVAGEELAGPVLLFDSFVSNNPRAGYPGWAALRSYGESMGTPYLVRFSPVRYLRFKVAAVRRWGLVEASQRLRSAVARRLRARTSPAAAPVDPATPALPGDRSRVMAEAMDVALRLVMGYEPQPADVTIALFDATTTAAFEFCWTGLATRGMVVHACGGAHLDMLEYPVVEQTARTVAAALASPRPAAEAPMQSPRVS